MGPASTRSGWPGPSPPWSSPRWLDLDVDREVLAYTHARFDIDLSCIRRLIDDGTVAPPPDRSYVARTIDHEVARQGALA